MANYNGSSKLSARVKLEAQLNILHLEKAAKSEFKWVLRNKPQQVSSDSQNNSSRHKSKTARRQVTQLRDSINLESCQKHLELDAAASLLDVAAARVQIKTLFSHS